MVEAEAISRPKSIRIWLAASRPRTLSLSLAPVAVAAALAFAGAGALRWGAVLVAALASALIQIATNLHNDAADFLRGADAHGRIGPEQVCAEGLIDAATVEKGARLCFAGAAIPSSRTAALYDRRSSVTNRSGAKAYFFRSLRISFSAACLLRFDWTSTSRTSPAASTARQR